MCNVNCDLKFCLKNRFVFRLDGLSHINKTYFLTIPQTGNLNQNRHISLQDIQAIHIYTQRNLEEHINMGIDKLWAPVRSYAAEGVAVQGAAAWPGAVRCSLFHCSLFSLLCSLFVPLRTSVHAILIRMPRHQ